MEIQAKPDLPPQPRPGSAVQDPGAGWADLVRPQATWLLAILLTTAPGGMELAAIAAPRPVVGMYYFDGWADLPPPITTWTISPRSIPSGSG